MGLFSKGDIVSSPINYRESDGYKAGYHNAIVTDRGEGDFTKTRLITHSDSGTNEPLDQSRISGTRFDDDSYITKDEFNSVSKYMKSKGGKYDL
jgi:hypothetical protein